MATYLTRAMVVLADDHPHSRAALETALRYAPRTVAVTGRDGGDVEGAETVQGKDRGAPSVNSVFKAAASDAIPWIGIRRDLTTPEDVLSAVVDATGRHASDAVPGFAVLLSAPDARPVRRILTILDRSDPEPSGMLVLAAVAAARLTGAEIDVLLIGAPGEEITSATESAQDMRVDREGEFFERAKRLIEDGDQRANWIRAEDVADRAAFVIELAHSGNYDLVVDDIGSVKLGSRIGRGGRIRKVFAPGGPGEIPLAVLAGTELSMLLVLDAIRMGLVSPTVAKGAGGAVLALGLLGAATPASAFSGDQGEQVASVSQQVEYYEAELGAVAAGEMTTAAETTVEAAATIGDTEAEQAAPVEAEVEQAVSADEDAPAEAEQAAADADAEAEPAPEPEPEPEPVPVPDVPDPDSITIDETPTNADVQAAEETAAASAEAADQAAADLAALEKEAAAAEEATAEAMAIADETSAEVQAAADEYIAAAETAVDAEGDVSGVAGLLASDEDRAAAQEHQAAEEEALDAVAATQAEAHQVLVDYESGLAAQEQAAADLAETEAAAAQAQAQAEYDAAYAAASQEAIADSRVAPVPGASVGTDYGVAGDAWSTGHHTGVDYPAPEGTEVVAAGSGTVVEVGYDGAYGNRVVVEHENGYYTTYNHLSATSVQVGDEVTAGEKVGEVGNTGNSFGAHLHFEVTHNGDGWSGGEFCDPGAWLAGDIG